MSKFKIALEFEVEADTARAAVEKFNERSAIPFARFPVARVVMMPNGNPQGGDGFVIPLGGPWDDVARAKALGYRVESGGAPGSSWYVEREGGGQARVFNDWHTDQESAWMAAVRHAKRNYLGAWKALG